MRDGSGDARTARRVAFTKEVARTPLAASPYSLRFDVAQRRRGHRPGRGVGWHSVEVLLKTYAKTVDGPEEAARRRVMDALGPGRREQEPGYVLGTGTCENRVRAGGPRTQLD
jgi:hypothetical protein